MITEVKTLKDDDYKKLVFFANAIVPSLLMFWDWQQENLGANPIEFVTRTTGVMALILLSVTLCLTPLAKIFSWNWLIKQRRQMGLFSFYYGSLHFLTYVLFDRGGDLTTVPADVIKRPFIAIGMICFAMMIPLAVTSTNKMIQRLGGKRWKQLHKLTYVIAVGAVIHFWMIVKSDITYPAFFAMIVAVLLSYRWKKAYFSSK